MNLQPGRTFDIPGDFAPTANFPSGQYAKEKEHPPQDSNRRKNAGNRRGSLKTDDKSDDSHAESDDELNLLRLYRSADEATRRRIWEVLIVRGAASYD